MPDTSTHNENKLLEKVGLTRKDWLGAKELVEKMKPMIEEWKVKKAYVGEFNYNELYCLMYNVIRNDKKFENDHFRS